MSPWIWAFIATFFAFSISSGDAVKCWVCSSERDYNCGDPFAYHNFPLVECDRQSNQPNSQSYQGSRSVCKKMKQRINGIPVVERSCAWEQSYGSDPCSNSYNSYGYTEHCSVCRYDACNGAASTGATYWVLAASAIAYATVKCL